MSIIPYAELGQIVNKLSRRLGHNRKRQAAMHRSLSAARRELVECAATLRRHEVQKAAFVAYLAEQERIAATSSYILPPGDVKRKFLAVFGPLAPETSRLEQFLTETQPWQPLTGRAQSEGPHGDSRA